MFSLSVQLVGTVIQAKTTHATLHTADTHYVQLNAPQLFT